MSTEEADSLCPQIDLSGLITTLAAADAEVNRVIVMSPPYMKELSAILLDTSTETLQSYFIWKAVQSLAPYIEADAVRPYKQFSNELQGKVLCSARIFPSRCTHTDRIRIQHLNAGEPVSSTSTMVSDGF